MDPLDWVPLAPSSWFADATQPIDRPLYLLLAVILTVTLIGGMATRLLAHTRFRGHRLKQRLAARAASYAIGLTVTGLVILLFRWQPVPLLSKPIWWYLWVLTAIGTIAYGFYYYRWLYPRRMFAYDELARRRRYLPRAAPSAGRVRQRQRRTR